LPSGRRSRRDEAGDSLIEVLFTLFVLGLTVLAVLSGLLTAVSSSDFQHKDAVIETALREYAENIKQAVAVNCHPGGTGNTAWTVANPDTEATLVQYHITIAPSLVSQTCPTSSTQYNLQASVANGGPPSTNNSAYFLDVVVSVP